MEEIKVGEYVRTKKGKIYKVTNVYILKITCGHTSLRYKDIKSHSKNIIDLIEEGDYVNGERVEDVFMSGLIHFEKFKIQTTEYNDYFEENIKTIVTKEQFNSIKYVIGE